MTDPLRADFCHDCGADSRVVETRKRSADGGLRRRRRCLRCGSAWTTVEVRHVPGCSIVALPVGELRTAVQALRRVDAMIKADAVVSALVPDDRKDAEDHVSEAVVEEATL